MCAKGCVYELHHIFTSELHHILAPLDAHTFISSHHTSLHYHIFTYPSINIFLCLPYTCTPFFQASSYISLSVTYLAILLLSSLRSRAIRRLVLLCKPPFVSACPGKAQALQLLEHFPVEHWEPCSDGLINISQQTITNIVYEKL